MFHSAALKLTYWYLAIIMAISAIFSLSLYRVYSSDLERNVNRQVAYFNNILGPEDASYYGSLRNHQLKEDLNHLKASLILFNILVLAGGGAASYWLARRTLQPIEEALESQSRFASDASHELRTPLTAIQTENEVALRNKNISKAQTLSLIKSNLEEVGKLKALSEGLLTLASGSNLENLTPVRIRVVIAAALARNEKSLTAKRMKVVNNSGTHKIMGDLVSLTELFSIFIDNAVKYSSPGSTIRIDSTIQRQFIAVKIHDNGKGISKSDLPFIFDRFYRADSSRTKDQNGGYGLGLAIAKRIVRSHNGYIEVKSTVDAGTVFTAFMPAAS
jgi:two-component system sensor histidine kinase CiaH